MATTPLAMKPRRASSTATASAWARDSSAMGERPPICS
jgi:hypothetical protein